MTDDIFLRALAGYRRYCDRHNQLMDQPSRVDSSQFGEVFVLRNGKKELYRFKPGTSPKPNATQRENKVIFDSLKASA